MKKYYYERNDYLLKHKVNTTLEDILDKNEEEFIDWVKELRSTVKYAWDNLGCPPRVGFTEEQIIEQYNKLYTFQWNQRKDGELRHELECIDELTNENNCLHNTHVGHLGNATNQFFPTMMKTKIKYTMSSDGKSIYDFFSDDNLLDTMIKHCKRHFWKDSYFLSSKSVTSNSPEDFLISSTSGIEWINTFINKHRIYNKYDFFLKQYKEENGYTGFSDKFKSKVILSVSKDDVLSIKDKLTERNLRHFSDDVETYSICFFQLGQKLFPKYFSTFSTGYDTQYAVNFPPLTAKYLYEKFTEDIKEQDVINIWDPSAGWGGRITGAMCVNDDRKIHYIGTDPNKDHWIPELNKTKYEYLADFINEKTTRSKGTLFPSMNTYHIIQEGSEVVQYNPEFQKYKGEIDLVFTSPPYFAKELYSFDEGQSHIKFGTYEDWRDGFLYQTIKTAVDWLANDRYLLWNIADVHFGKDFLPLETDSIRFLKELGMTYITTLKMVMASMPGKGRVNEDGTPVFKNSCKVKGQWRKYEPISVWKKI